MIELFYYRTPNARKILLCLEELGLPYVLRWIDIGRGDQFSDEYLDINLYGKIPAIIDPTGLDGRPIRLFESGAILLYLAEKTGELISSDTQLRYETIQWVFWQTSNQGPLLGQATHFVTHAPRQGIELEYAQRRYLGEAQRLYEVLDQRLERREFLVGDSLSIADIANWPWTRPAKGQGIDLEAYPNVARWSRMMSERPSAAVKPIEDSKSPERGEYDARQWQVLFQRPRTRHI